eukprot:6016-Prymnesium_polylepis.1
MSALYTMCANYSRNEPAALATVTLAGACCTPHILGLASLHPTLYALRPFIAGSCCAGNAPRVPSPCATVSVQLKGYSVDTAYAGE